MLESVPETGGNYVDRGSRKATTLDRAFDDPTTSLQRLRDLDLGDQVARRVLTPEEEVALQKMYRENREVLELLGATLIESDYFRAPRTAREAAA